MRLKLHYNKLLDIVEVSVVHQEDVPTRYREVIFTASNGWCITSYDQLAFHSTNEEIRLALGVSSVGQCNTLYGHSLGAVAVLVAEFNGRKNICDVKSQEGYIF